MRRDCSSRNDRFDQLLNIIGGKQVETAWGNEDNCHHDCSLGILNETCT